MKAQIQDFPGYHITPEGRVTNKHNRLIHAYLNPASGYEQISLTRDGKRICTTIHRLLALTFLSKGEDKVEVNHRDGVKHNNNLGNLEWVTPQENSDHAHRTGLYRKKDAVLFQLHPQSGKGVGHVVFRVRGLIDAGFNPSNVMNTIANPLTPGGLKRHSQGYIPSRLG